MYVSEIMTKDPKAVGPNTSLLDVASMMNLYRLPALPVVDEHNKLIGNISEKDILKNLLPSMEDIVDGSVNTQLDSMISNYSKQMRIVTFSVMTKNPISAKEDMHILKATALMTSHNFRRLPVIDSMHQLIGVMSLGDVHKAIFHSHISVNNNLSKTSLNTETSISAPPLN